MTAVETIAFNRGVRAVIELASQVGGLIETETVAAGACDATSAGVMRRVLDEFAQQVTALLRLEPAGEPADEEADRG